MATSGALRGRPSSRRSRRRRTASGGVADDLSRPAELAWSSQFPWRRSTRCNFACRTYVPSGPAPRFPAMFHGRNDLGQRVVDGVDLVIDFATLGEYGIEPTRAEGPTRRRTDRHPRPDRRPGWEAPARAPRSACGAVHHEARPAEGHPEWRFPGTRPSRANFRAAVDRYSA